MYESIYHVDMERLCVWKKSWIAVYFYGVYIFKAR